MKRTIKTSDKALLFIKLVESFAFLDELIDCEFPLIHCSLPQSTLSLVASSGLKQLKNTLRMTVIRHFIPRKPVLTISQLRCAVNRQ